MAATDHLSGDQFPRGPEEGHRRGKTDAIHGRPAAPVNSTSSYGRAYNTAHKWHTQYFKDARENMGAKPLLSEADPRYT